jgi:hypothetical protein
MAISDAPLEKRRVRVIIKQLGATATIPVGYSVVVCSSEIYGSGGNMISLKKEISYG